jgi:Flp pilus assembly protein TadG
MGDVRAAARPRERGAAMVEFALVVPVFLALIFGVISYGYMLSYRQAISQSAAEGARAAAIAPAVLSDADRLTRTRAALNDALNSYGVRCDGTTLRDGATAVGSCTVQATGPCPSDATRRCAVVTVTHRYRDHPLVPSFPGLGITLPETLTYRAVVEVT